MKTDLPLIILLPTFSVIVALSGSTSVYAQENTTDSENPKFFAIQHANSGSISEINKTFTLAFTNESNKIIFASDISRTFTLELNNISNKTIISSNRPDRIVSSVRTLDFIGNWSTGKDSFTADPPNALLIVDKLEKNKMKLL